MTGWKGSQLVCMHVCACVCVCTSLLLCSRGLKCLDAFYYFPAWADEPSKDFFLFCPFPPPFQIPFFFSLCVINEPEYIHTFLWKTKSCHFISGNQAALNSAARKPRCYYIPGGNLSIQKGGNIWTIITKYSLKMLLLFSCWCWGQYFGECVPVRNCSALLRRLTFLKSSASPQISVTLNGLPVKSEQPGIKPPIFWQPLYSLGSYKALKLIM